MSDNNLWYPVYYRKSRSSTRLARKRRDLSPKRNVDLVNPVKSDTSVNPTYMVKPPQYISVSFNDNKNKYKEFVNDKIAKTARKYLNTCNSRIHALVLDGVKLRTSTAFIRKHPDVFDSDNIVITEFMEGTYLLQRQRAKELGIPDYHHIYANADECIIRKIISTIRNFNDIMMFNVVYLDFMCTIKGRTADCIQLEGEWWNTFDVCKNGTKHENGKLIANYPLITVYNLLKHNQSPRLVLAVTFSVRKKGMNTEMYHRILDCLFQKTGYRITKTVLSDTYYGSGTMWSAIFVLHHDHTIKRKSVQLVRGSGGNLIGLPKGFNGYN